MKKLTLLFLSLACVIQTLCSQGSYRDSLSWARSYDAKSYVYWFDYKDAAQNSINRTDDIYEINVSHLPVGVHTIYACPMDSLNNIYPPFSSTFFKAVEIGDSATLVRYWFDSETIIRTDTLVDGGFIIDVSGLRMGIHTLYTSLYYPANGYYAPAKSTLFMKEAGITTSFFWYNDSIALMHDTVFPSPQNPLKWKADLDVDSFPIRSTNFCFENDTAPMMYARDTVSFLFVSESGAMIYSDGYGFVDHHVGKRVVADTLRPNTVVDVPALQTDEVKWYCMNVVVDDTITLTSNNQCTMQLFEPDATEILAVKGDTSTMPNQLVIRTNGVHWLAVHDTTSSVFDPHQITYNVQHAYFIPDTAEICQGEYYEWQGERYTETGVYRKSFKTVANCDSVHEFVLTVNPVYLFADADTICQGQVATWRGRSLTESGVYYDSLLTVDGCDSVYEFTLTVNPTYLFEESAAICQGAVYTWRGRSLTESGVYYDSLLTINGCDSVYELTLTVNPVYLFEESGVICQGVVYTWRGRSLTESGVYYDSLLTKAGCDSVYKFALTVNPTYLFEESAVICQGNVYSWRGRSLTESGVYYDSLLTMAGCDSVYELNLTVNPTYLIEDIQSICQGQTYNFRGRMLTTSGVYYDSLRTSAGCDSVYKLTLTVNPTFHNEEFESICQGTSYNFRGRQLTAAGVYYDSLLTVNGCDSVYELNLTVNPTYLFEDVQSICQGQTYNFRGRMLTTPGVYYDSLRTSAGCDSVFKLTLSVNPTYFVTEAEAICHGATYTWHGRDLTEAGIYYDTLRTTAGCDSVCELILTVNPTYLIADVDTTVLDVQLPFKWRYKKYAAAGVYYDTLQTVAGCDSIFQLTLRVNKYIAAAPDSLTGEQDGKYSVRFTWVNGSETDPDNFTYLVSKTPVNNPEMREPTGTGLNVAEYTLNNAKVGTTYYFYVKNVYGVASSAWTGTSITTLPKLPAVLDLAADNVRNSSFDASWTKHEYGIETKWEVKAVGKTDSIVDFSRTIKGGETGSCVVSGLRGATTYILTVTPLYGSSRGVASSIEVTTMDDCNAPVIISAAQTGKTEVTFEWSNGSATQPNNFTYIISKSALVSPESAAPTATEFTGTSAVVSNASYSTTYHLYIKNIYNTISSEWIHTTVKTAPRDPAVENLHAENIGATLFTAVWNKNQFGSEGKWNVEVRDNKTKNVVFSTVAKSESCLCTGLTMGKKYILTVVPVIGTRTGDTARINVTTVVLNPTAPTNLAGEQIAKTSVKFTWENPSATEGNNFSIVVSTVALGNPDGATPRAEGLTAAEYVFQNAKPSTTYHVYVKNIYMGASSAWTHATFMTEVKYPAVVNLVTDNVTETSFHATWERHPYGTEARWTVEVSETATGTVVFTKTVKTTPECNVTGLNAGTEYEISVRAVVGSYSSEPTTAEVTTSGVQIAPENEDEFIAEEVIPAEAFVNMSRLHVENLIEGVDVTIVDASGRMVYDGKAENTHMEFDLSVRGVYMVVIRGEQNQVLKVVY